MSLRITKSTELPEWFDTKKYGNAIQLDARGWYEQIVTRRRCYQMVWHAVIEDGDLEDNAIYGIKPSALLNAVRSNPIFDFFGSHYQESINRNLHIKSVDQSDGEKHPPGISGINANDVANLILRLPNHRKSEFLDWLAVMLGKYSKSYESIDYSEELPDWLMEPLQGLGFRAVKVDHALPDKVLRQSFALYLQQNLQPSEPYLKGKPKRSNMFLEWCNCGLLQYMDLETWSLETDTEITNKALARGIFPDNVEKGEENIRTTTKTHAERFLDEGIEVSVLMHTLRAYAELEDFLAGQS